MPTSTVAMYFVNLWEMISIPNTSTEQYILEIEQIKWEKYTEKNEQTVNKKAV
jgi:hypothetical protein